jgi:hypothetical protein
LSGLLCRVLYPSASNIEATPGIPLHQSQGYLLLISVHSISARSTQAIYCPTFGMSPTGWANVKPNTTANSTLPTVFTRRPWTQARARLPRFGHSGVYSNSFRIPKYPVLPPITHKDLKFLLGDLILPRPHYGYSDLVLPPHQIIQTYKPEHAVNMCPML